MEATWINADLSIDDVMQAWPATLRRLVRRRMACIGCEAAPFHTVGDVARIYDVPIDALLTDLRDAAVGGVAHGATRSRRYGPGRADQEPQSVGRARR
jgi:hybrid cluster-associated redox disulfide protein